MSTKTPGDKLKEINLMVILVGNKWSTVVASESHSLLLRDVFLSPLHSMWDVWPYSLLSTRWHHSPTF